MANSTSSSPNKALNLSNSRCESDDQSLEESGWTQYLDGFSEYNREVLQQEVITSSSSSMISDAGTGPEWTLMKDVNVNGNLPKFAKRLNFKSNNKRLSHDDSLEDTASSPVNSPKIAMSFRRMDINSRATNDDQESYMVVDGGISTDDQRYNKHNVIVKGKQELLEHKFCKDDGLTELKKKGLCLVPVSMMKKHFG